MYEFDYCHPAFPVRYLSELFISLFLEVIQKDKNRLVLLPEKLSTPGGKSLKICTFYSLSTHIFYYICRQNQDSLLLFLLNYPNSMKASHVRFTYVIEVAKPSIKNFI